jgi:nitric oxide reductase large subunit
MEEIDMKLMKKILVIFILIIMFGFNIYNICASAASKVQYDDEMKTLINNKYEDTTDTDKKINNITATVITVVRIIGVAIAIVMLLVIAMKYMTAAPGEKADIKKSAIVYVVGAVVLFGATALLGIIAEFSKGIQ